MKKQWTGVLLLLSVLIILTGCQALDDWLPCKQTGTVSGRITDQRNYGDGDVTVILDGGKTNVTNYTGYYVFKGVTKGDHEIALGNPLPTDLTGNDIQQKKTVKVGCGAEVTADFQLTYYHNPTATDRAIADLDFKLNSTVALIVIILLGLALVTFFIH